MVAIYQKIYGYKEHKPLKTSNDQTVVIVCESVALRNKENVSVLKRSKTKITECVLTRSFRGNSVFM